MRIENVLYNYYPNINDYPVNLLDKQTPVLVPFGPECSGKLFLLGRLYLYLMEEGYNICPNYKFVPFILSSKYRLDIENFHEIFSGGRNAHRPMLPLLFSIKKQ